ncbi:MAG: HD domain-containing protein, partial [Eubacterium sp.]
GISVEIVKLVGYSQDRIDRIYYGALLHDIGKISIPIEILEYPGRLSYQAMNIMRTHVEITEEILCGIVAEDICKLAVRHHECPDGSGYPRGLSGESLTEEQRIIAVADVLSALRGKRSYKDTFSKEKIMDIIKEMGESGKLCDKITTVVLSHYDEIMAGADKQCEALLATYTHVTDEFEALYQKLKEI